MISTKFTKSKIAIVLFINSLMFVLFYSISTSPIYSTNGDDSAIFQTIGRYWVENGLIPYLDLFDHKGPIIFLINAIGYLLTGNKYGILIIQIVTIFLFCVFIYRIGRLELSKKSALFWTIVNLFFLVSVYEGGNLTEEYVLPFITYSLYCIYKYLLCTNLIKHNAKYSIVYGITFGFCMMTRITNALPMCIGVFVILIILIWNKQWKNIFYNMLGFIAGTSVIVAPFMLYFGLHGAMYDFWYGTILFNIDYAKSSTWIWNQDVSYMKLAAYIIYILFCCLPITIVGLKSLHEKLYAKGSFLVLLGLISMEYLVSNNTYRHYSMIMIPYFILTICEIKKICDIRLQKYILIIMFVLTIMSSTAATGIMLVRNSIQNDNYEELLTYVPKTELNSLMAYNINASIYLDYDIAPKYTYFHHQDWIGEKNDILMGRIRTTFKEGNVKWILVNGDIVGIQDILDAKYICLKSFNDKDSVLKLYKLKQ